MTTTTYNIYNYMPKRYSANSDEQAVREFIYSFKKGEQRSTEIAAEMTSMKLGYRPNTIFVCIPASSSEVNRNRYEYFSYLVCQSTGMHNAYSHVHVKGCKKSLHNTKKGDSHLHGGYSVDIDNQYFEGREVVIFDDIITRGRSFSQFSHIIESAGANVIGGFFLAKTYHNN